MRHSKPSWQTYVRAAYRDGDHVSIEQQNQISALQARVDALEKVVQQLLDAIPKPKRETLTLKKLFTGTNG